MASALLPLILPCALLGILVQVRYDLEVAESELSDKISREVNEVKVRDKTPSHV